MLSQLEWSTKHGIYPITNRIAIGRFATPDRAFHLLDAGYSHVLNVSEADSVVHQSAGGFQRIIDHRLSDLARIPDDAAVACLDSLHEMLQADGSKVYLHCIACQNRSPTILWLYLLALGVESEFAKSAIVERCPDAVPGHRSLIDDTLMQIVVEHGKRHFLPLHDPAIIEPAY